MLAFSLAIVIGGCFITFVGYSVKKKGSTSFIAGNNVVFIPKNEKKLASRIGINGMIFGIEVVSFPIIYQLYDLRGSYIAILAVIHLLIVFILMLLDQFEI
ncbi:hypothetical protein PU629_09250 [Pullulanibacillus sp. KACC 23026]|uniref:hypothetical protein n=1 Tax=Pullulanibacillus sp. KACC 23026 TaxID=3028315 RepID=UPI0023B05BAF|nr:hypothetical protein [Pullulanibacillus sp. KACC 23026]WEG14522.1 hypothetical protein PU629_09250 [Pullulanibacillus sp. KACC 23026]